MTSQNIGSTAKHNGGTEGGKNTNKSARRAQLATSPCSAMLPAFPKGREAGKAHQVTPYQLHPRAKLPGS